jgi:NAD dependent epimerase/dehydratase
MELSGKHILVTGGGGFIGSHVVERLLAEGGIVRAMVRYSSNGSLGHLEAIAKCQHTNLEIVASDIRDSFAVGRLVEGCQVVLHLAALIGIPYSYRASEAYVATNICGTLNILEACRAHGVERLVHTSTSETYGTARFTPIDEQHPLQAQSPYAATKIAADKLVESYHRSFALPASTLRPFNTFGPRQSARAVIPTIIAQALLGDEVRLGRVTPVRDLTFVEDTAAAFVALARCDEAVGKVVNVGTGRGMSIGELADRILYRMGREKVCRVVVDHERVRPEDSEVFELVCDNRLARDLIGWMPRVALDDALDRTIAYVEAHLTDFGSARYTL